MASQDTEITLGTGKMLALFFGLVALCGVFFGMGFYAGKSRNPQRIHSCRSVPTGSRSRFTAIRDEVRQRLLQRSTKRQPFTFQDRRAARRQRHFVSGVLCHERIIDEQQCGGYL